jgi:hypothetical protein
MQSPQYLVLKVASNSFFSTPNATSAYEEIADISRNTNILNRSPLITTPFIPAISGRKVSRNSFRKYNGSCRRLSKIKKKTDNIYNTQNKSIETVNYHNKFRPEHHLPLPIPPTLYTMIFSPVVKKKRN